MSLAPVSPDEPEGPMEAAKDEGGLLGQDKAMEPTEETRFHRLERHDARAPSAREVKEHERLHMPYRSWCRVCVQARAPDQQHVPRRVPEERVRSEVSLDYCFLRDEPGSESVVVLVGRDRRSGLYIGHRVPQKGAALDWIGAQVVRDLQKMGYHGLVTLRGD